MTLYSLTVFCVDQVVTAPTEGPVHSLTRLGAGEWLGGQIDARFFEEFSRATIRLVFDLETLHEKPIVVRLITPSPTEPSTRLPLLFIRRLEFISIPVYFDLIVFVNQ